MDQDQTALADKHTDIHKNQYSSTTSTAAALIKLPDEYRGFCVLFVDTSLYGGVETSIHQNIDSGGSGFEVHC